MCISLHLYVYIYIYTKVAPVFAFGASGGKVFLAPEFRNGLSPFFARKSTILYRKVFFTYTYICRGHTAVHRRQSRRLIETSPILAPVR